MEWWGFFFFLLSLPSQFLWHARRRTAVQDACEGTRLDTLRSPVRSLAPTFQTALPCMSAGVWAVHGGSRCVVNAADWTPCRRTDGRTD